MIKHIFIPFIFLLTLFISSSVNAQTNQFSGPKKYEIGGLSIDGLQYLDANSVILLSGLRVGDFVRIPGDDISLSIKRLWKQDLFSDVQIDAVKVVGNTVFLKITVKERPRLSRFKFNGVKKSDAENLRDEINLYSGKQLTENLVLETKNKIKGYFIDKGFYNAEIDIVEKKDTIIGNGVLLTINIKKNNRVKINNIFFNGNENISSGNLRKAMKETKQRSFINVFKSSKFISSLYDEDKSGIIAKYRKSGYRDAKITNDSIAKTLDGNINLYVDIKEGKKYYYRNITWAGNSKYSSGYLDTILGIKKGDVYNQELLQQRIQMDMTGYDVSSLYMDRGYLTFYANPVEVLIENDSIDIQVRINEGKQFKIGRILIAGNNKTNEDVIRREIRTRPGDLFSRNDIIRTQRELSQLGYFNPENFGIDPVQNPEDGTVDITYTVEETANDQIELSAGWGGGFLVGTIGLKFNNFSIQNFFKKDAWNPLPSGDGQSLALRISATGVNYQNYSLSFTEPWLGGKKPTSLSFSVYRSVQSNGQSKVSGLRQSMTITGVSVGIGQRLQWPDDYFQLFNQVSYQNFDLNRFTGIFTYSDGVSNNLSFLTRLSRNSIDQPLYPRSGSNIVASFMFTPPYSAFGGEKDYADMPDEEKYKWVEYYKWKFTAEWFTPLSNDEKLVLRAKLGWGGLGYYNSEIGYSPFERFTLGGSGLSGSFNQFYYGREIVSLRGYDEGVLTYDGGSPLIAKYTLELRYPLSLNPSATVYFLGFAEAGNTYRSYKTFEPFNVVRSAGLGVRVFLPMFGQLGLDYGWGFDSTIPYGVINNPGAGQFHFTLGANIGEL